MGIIFTTRDWLGAEVFVDHVYGGWTYYVEAVEGNAYDVAQAFATWLMDPARPWITPEEWWGPGPAPDDWYEDMLAGILVPPDRLLGVSFAVVPAPNGRLTFAFTLTGTTLTFDCNGVAAQRISLSPNADGSDRSGTMQGSVSASPATRGWQRWGLEVGARTAAASYRMGHGSTSARRPAVALGFRLEDVAAFEESLRVAARPRRGYIYDEGHDTWRHGSFGRHKLAPHSEDDTTVFAGELEFLGDP